jgi:DNA-nicking Smr family endonuclease
MARRRKRKKIAGNRNTGGKALPFNPALRGRITLPDADLPSSSPPEEESGQTDLHLNEDEKLFEQAMAGVSPLSDENNRFLSPPKTDTRPPHPAPDDELETMTRLSELVSGVAELDITFSDEYMEGSVPGFDPKLMQRLKRGEFPIQSYLDLHGLTKQDAQEKVTEFILKSFHAGLRCVLVVHGRGLNSQDHIPILKERLPYWLTRGPARKLVLAFSTARPYDGGSGALYILLRKRKGTF